MSVSIVSARSTASTDHAASVALPAAETDARAKSRSMASKTLDVAELDVGQERVCADLVRFVVVLPLPRVALPATTPHQHVPLVG